MHNGIQHDALPTPAAGPTAKGTRVIALIHDLLLHTTTNQAAANVLAAELAASAETADGATLFGTVLEMERLAQAQCKIAPPLLRCKQLLTSPG